MVATKFCYLEETWIISTLCCITNELSCSLLVFNLTSDETIDAILILWRSFS